MGCETFITWRLTKLPMPWGDLAPSTSVRSSFVSSDTSRSGATSRVDTSQPEPTPSPPPSPPQSPPPSARPPPLSHPLPDARAAAESRALVRRTHRARRVSGVFARVWPPCCRRAPRATAAAAGIRWPPPSAVAPEGRRSVQSAPSPVRSQARAEHPPRARAAARSHCAKPRRQAAVQPPLQPQP